jgi:hypothetical protein
MGNPAGVPQTPPDHQDARGVASEAPPRSAVTTIPLPRVASAPEIHVGEAELGRVSLVAIRHELAAGGSVPEITYGETQLGRGSLVAVGRELAAMSSVPEIIVQGEAAIGRETMVAIDLDGKPRPSSSPDSIRVDLVSMPELQAEELSRASSGEGARATVPWVELPGDAKRAADAASAARKLAAPKVSVKLDDADEGVLDAATAELGTAVPGFPAAPPPPARVPQPTLAYDGAPPKPLPPKTAKR